MHPNNPLLPPTGAEPPKNSKGVRPGFQEQKRIIIQLLKDWKLPYSTGRGSSSGESTAPTYGSSYPLNKEVFKASSGSDYAQSRRLVLNALQLLRKRVNVSYGVISSVFLHDTAGDADYEILKDKASKPKDYPASAAFFDHLEVALNHLTVMLMHDELYAQFPKKFNNVNHRRQTMEESYREIHRVFRAWCKDLSAKHNRYRNKAFENTAVQCNVAKSTVERAVHFIEEGAAATETPCRRTVAKPTTTRRHPKIKKDSE